MPHDLSRAGAADARRMRVVIVGSGVAGLVTALALVERHDVTIVTKSAIDESNTRYAQGGIAAAVMPGDTVESHIADTLAAGAGLSDPEAVRVLCEEGPERIRDLIRWGVEFDRRDPGDPTSEFDAGLEGAHSFHRILHAGGDATGFEVESALVRAVRASAVRVLEQTFLADLVVTAGCATGVTVLRDGVTETLPADAVVLASGGIGQLYPHTTNPTVTTGDGAAAALRAGAVLADVELVQFHPTALAVPGAFLVSEAVRGDGAVLRNAAGERFMLRAHPLAELAPRDVVARAIASEMAATGAPVVLDATALGAEELERRFPTISAACREHGFDWAREPVPVAPAAHYWMGGVATDLDGRTSLPGLFAVGEVACTGVHGANRLASNSLLESLVFAHRCAAAIAADAGADAAALVGVGEPPAGADAGADSAAPLGAGAPPAGAGADTAGVGGAGAPRPGRSAHATVAVSAGVSDVRAGAPAAAAATAPVGAGVPEAGAGRARSATAAGAARPAGVGAARGWRGLPNSVALDELVPSDAEELDASERRELEVAVPVEPTRAELHTVMWRAAGVHRGAAGLREARDVLAGWALPVDAASPVERRETANLLQLARVIVAAALAREESRGAHFRADFPDTEAAFAHHIAVTAGSAVPLVATAASARPTTPPTAVASHTAPTGVVGIASHTAPVGAGSPTAPVGAGSHIAPVDPVDPVDPVEPTSPSVQGTTPAAAGLPATPRTAAAPAAAPREQVTV